LSIYTRVDVSNKRRRVQWLGAINVEKAMMVYIQTFAIDPLVRSLHLIDFNAAEVCVGWL
jgi:hypothetical protein